VRKQIVKRRLYAAYEARRIESWNQLAKKSGVVHTTLTRLAGGRIKKVNEETLRGLSRALGVPGEWLTGERDDLPYVQQFDYAPGATRTTSKVSLWERPTTDYIRWSWLMQRIESAVRRDLDDWCGREAKDAYDSWGRSLRTAFAEMAHSFVWRLALQRPAREGSWNELWGVADVPTIEWLEQAIEPWLEGRAYLNADVIRNLFNVFADPQRLWGSEIRDSDARRALEEYAVLCTKAVKKELAEIGPEERERNGPRRASRTKSAVSTRMGRRRRG
jgi:transcriptional regulator with XRE-family HTH domain